MPVTLQALLLVETVGPVQVRRFTLRVRDQRSIYVNARWMQKSTQIPKWHRLDPVA